MKTHNMTIHFVSLQREQNRTEHKKLEQRRREKKRTEHNRRD